MRGLFEFSENAVQIHRNFPAKVLVYVDNIFLLNN